MDTLLRKLWNSWRTGKTERDRRRVALRRALECDALEGRQLLSAVGGAWAAQHAAVVHHQAGHAGLRHHGRPRHGGAASLAAPTQQGMAMAAVQPNSQALPMPGTTAPAQAGSAPTGQVQTWTARTMSAPGSTVPATVPIDKQMPPAGTQPGPGLGLGAGGSFTAHGPMLPAQPATPPSNPALAAALEALHTDMHAILAKSQVTVAQTVALVDDHQAIGKASTSPPSPETLQAFQKDLASIQGAVPTDAQKTQLEADYTAMVKSQGVSDSSLIARTIGDAEAIFAASNVTSDDLARIAADEKAVQTALGSSDPGNPTLGKFGNLGLGAGFDALMGAGGFDAWQIGLPGSGPASFGNPGLMPGGPMSMPGKMGSPPAPGGAPTGAPTSPGGSLGSMTTWTAPVGQATTGMPVFGVPGGIGDGKGI